MGLENSNFFRSAVPSIFNELHAEEDRLLKLEAERRMSDAVADAKAVWALADMMIPVDVKEMAERWNMKETILEIWRNAFIAGWRASHRSRNG